MERSLVEVGYASRDDAVRNPTQWSSDDWASADEVERTLKRPGLAPSQGLALASVAGALVWAGLIAVVRALFF